MRILVVCGAGASSTFVAQRVRHAAQARGLEYSAFAGTEQSLPIDLDAADVVLVGPHLAHAMEQIATGALIRPRARYAGTALAPEPAPPPEADAPQQIAQASLWNI